MCPVSCQLLIFCLAKKKSISTQRIRVITRALQSQLETSFRAGLETEDRATLNSCLQTYALIGHQEAAEAMFSGTVVHPYMEKVSAYRINILVDKLVVHELKLSCGQPGSEELSRTWLTFVR